MHLDTYTNINGKLLPQGSAVADVNNSAFRYGLGLFETMLVQNGKIRLADYHWQRLFSGLHSLNFNVPALFTPSFLEDEVLRTVNKNKLLPLCRVRLQVYAGSGGIFETGGKPPLFVVECYPLTPETQLINDNGLVVGIATGIRKSNDTLCNLKTSNALIYAVAAAQAKQNKWNDALVCNAAGNIIESAIANIFWVKDNVLFTPPLSEGCIAGVMRRHIISSVQGATETHLTLETLMNADEVILTNAIKPIRWVGEISGIKFGSTYAKLLFAKLFT